MVMPNNRTPLKKLSPFSHIIKRYKKCKSNSHKKLMFDKTVLQNLFHPDYILFDWEYFSRELEFE